MDPDFYRRLTNFRRELPQQAPVNEEPQEQTLDEPTPRPDTNWSVYSLNESRGILRGETDPNDPRNMVGGRADAHRSEVGPWMSAVDQQPFIWDAWGKGGGEDSTARALTPTTPASSYPHPSLSLPHPSLSLDFRMSVLLSPRISIGSTPFGHRNWISFTGGTWSASWGSGIVLPGGQDSQIIIPNKSARLEANYLLQTHDNPPAHIAIKTHGWRTGPPEILAQLDDPELADKIDPNTYKFRLFIEMETGDERYNDRLNCGMWVGSGMRKGQEVIYDAYRIS